MEKVLTTTQLVLWLDAMSIKELKLINDQLPWRGGQLEAIAKYANLMQQPLTLSMFVPCVDGKLIEDMKMTCHERSQDFAIECLGEKDGKEWVRQSKVFWQAKEQVLFDGCKLEEIKSTDGKGEGILFGEKLIYCRNKLTGKDSFVRGFKTIEDLAQQIDLVPTEAFKNSWCYENK